MADASDKPAQEAPADEPLARPIDQCVEMVFPTPIAIHEWPDSQALNAALTSLVLAEEAKSKGLARSNVGGWHSDMAFLFGEDQPLVRLRARMQRMVGEMTKGFMRPEQGRFSLEGWANVLRQGQYNSIHVHPNSTWSGVYYVTGNPPPEAGSGGTAQFSGKIEFIDPRPGASATYSVENSLQRRCLFSPGPGTMIVFPSWLQHQVHPYFGPDVRVSIAFNVFVT